MSTKKVGTVKKKRVVHVVSRFRLRRTRGIGWRVSFVVFGWIDLVLD